MTQLDPAAPPELSLEHSRPTQRSQAKADRRAALLEAAAGLFAERGFNGVSIEDLGSAVGISGPAVYRHFPSKQAVLEALLVGVSEGLLSGGQQVEDAAADAASALHSLIGFHVDFALSEPDTIRVQDRDLDALTDAARREVRRLQRRYVEVWIRVLGELHPALTEDELRVRVQGTFGLLNSTPHTARIGAAQVAPDAVRPVLERMAWSALTSP
ncbi:SACE_7040 family transcriptional regulator [Leifsonia sp. 2MCAF36]|uniref:SACE_7040 family transcriptional regulator n=1 Tax=Leifsonia sp. 2MCAF36 TaxID=3232988 RepID=UPI003F98F6DB